MTVDIICAVYNGAEYLPEFLRSLAEQTHGDWRLWVRDDGSTDDTVAIVRAKAAVDARVRLVEDAEHRLGAPRAFARLLERLPDDAAYVMCADQDDVWLPRKIERTLGAMRAAEQTVSASTPVLVHTDLAVADARLRVMHPSFWAYSEMDPEPVSLRRLTVQNVTTGATAMLNRPLRKLVGAAPREAIFHDWWYALVATAFGKVVAIREATVLYRQHDSNAVGARDARVPLRGVPGAILARLDTTSAFRDGVRQTAEQARAFLNRYADRLDEADRRFLAAYARIPERGFLRRKIDVLRFRALPDRGVLRTLGVLLRG